VSVEKAIYIRPLRESDQKLWADWLFQYRATSHFDPELYKRGICDVYVAYTKADGIIAFFSVNRAFVHSAPAPKPGLDSGMYVRAMAAMQSHLVTRANEEKVAEIYVQPSSGDHFADILRDYSNFEDCKLPFLCLRVHTLESQLVQSAAIPEQPLAENPFDGNERS
jgi:hypothetical protein